MLEGDPWPPPAARGCPSTAFRGKPRGPASSAVLADAVPTAVRGHPAGVTWHRSVDEADATRTADEARRRPRLSAHPRGFATAGSLRRWPTRAAARVSAAQRSCEPSDGDRDGSNGRHGGGHRQQQRAAGNHHVVECGDLGRQLVV